MHFPANLNSMSDQNSQRLQSAIVTAAPALFIFFWASGFIAAKYGLPYAEPFTFLTIRFLIALILLVPISVLWQVRWPVGLSAVGHVVVAGFLVQTVYLIGVFYAVFLGISTGVIALIVGLQPLVTGALAGSVLGEQVTVRQWGGLALGFLGLGLVVADNVDLASDQAWGAALGGLALAGITVGTLYQKKFCADVDIRAAVTIQNGFSCIVIGLLAISFESMIIDWTGEFIFALFWSGIALSVIAIALYYLLVRRGATAKVTSLLYLSPPTTAVMGWMIFGETFAPVAILGMIIAVAGVALANR